MKSDLVNLFKNLLVLSSLLAITFTGPDGILYLIQWLYTSVLKIRAFTKITKNC